MFRSIWNRNSITFDGIPQTEDTEKLISGSDTDSNTSESPTRRRRPFSTCSISLLWLTSIVGTFMGGVWIGTFPLHDADSFCTARLAKSCKSQSGDLFTVLTKAAPVMRDVEMSYTTEIFNGSLFLENAFRQKGGPNSPVDDAWTSLGVDCVLSPNSHLKFS